MRPDPAQALIAFDILELVFGGGKRWLQRAEADRSGRRCLLGAIDYVHSINQFPSRHVLHYLQKAAGLSHPIGLAWLNDRAESFADIEDFIGRARALAKADLKKSARKKPARAPRPVGPTQGFPDRLSPEFGDIIALDTEARSDRCPSDSSPSIAAGEAGTAARQRYATARVP